MKNIYDYLINEFKAQDVLTGEAFFKKDDLEGTFLSLIDDATYNLERNFNINKTCPEIAEIVIKAMERYKNFK